MKSGNFLFTSESVTEGHPDKVADQVSDHILDKILEQGEGALTEDERDTLRRFSKRKPKGHA